MDDSHYIERVLKGDLNAYTPLVDKYRSYVYTLVKRTCPNPAEAEELAQDVFVKAYEHLSTFRGSSAFSTWLYRIAFNTAISHARKKKRYGVSIDKIEIRDYLEEESEEAENRERAYIALEKIISTLPPEEQMLLSLYYTKSLMMEEVAYISGLSLSNTKVRIHRIRKKLYLLYESTTP
jgi:RNA polymerase sigma-70 factor (ECF subfamily)